MNVNQLIKHLRKKAPRPNWILFGEDEVLLYLAEQKLIAKFMTETTDKIVVDGRFNKWSKVFDALGEESPLYDNRLVVIRNADKFKENINEVLRFLNQKDLMGHVVVTATWKRKPDEVSVEFDRELVGDVQCNKFDEESDALKLWLDLELEDRGLAISDSLKSLLIDSFGSSVEKITNILNQVQLLKEDEAFDESVFIELLTSDREYGVFDLTRAVAVRDTKKAVLIAKTMMESKVEVVKQFIPLMERQFLLTFKCRSMVQSNASIEDIALAFDLNQHFVGQFIAMTRQFDHPRVLRNMSLLHKMRLRNFPTPLDLLFLVVGLCA